MQTEKWNIFKTNNPNFRISKDLKITFEGTETECKKWLEKTFKVIEYKTNELLKTITFLTKEHDSKIEKAMVIE